LLYYFVILFYRHLVYRYLEPEALGLSRRSLALSYVYESLCSVLQQRRGRTFWACGCNSWVSVLEASGYALWGAVTKLLHEKLDEQMERTDGTPL